MKKRERLEIIFDILFLVRKHNNAIKPTRLLRFSNLSSQRFSRYIEELLEKGFVRRVNDSKARYVYCLTDKGFAYLEKYEVIVQFVESFEL